MNHLLYRSQSTSINASVGYLDVFFSQVTLLVYTEMFQLPQALWFWFLWVCYILCLSLRGNFCTLRSQQCRRG